MPELDEPPTICPYCFQPVAVATGTVEGYCNWTRDDRPRRWGRGQRGAWRTASGWLRSCAGQRVGIAARRKLAQEARGTHG